ncbi:ATP-binding protein [Pseudomonas sp. GD03858]|uniref:AAA family ATPase n=1 Tax=unclassified Pseudomonas TaxID=196821 RepID=UPI00244CED58|nr:MULTISPECIES: AAA family ATPase [unclassified Pseudomonas]MDH0645731.1 ATP-binding protein [Pseudomonas sp. GD03867]MDH0661162.1 ATP-binding protein [Pseudomonas sp. GD03858]
MDESIIWLGRLLAQAKEQQLQGKRPDQEFEQVLLYTFGAQLVDWTREPWSGALMRQDKTLPRTSTLLTRTLVDACKAKASKTTLDLSRVEECANLLSSWARLRPREECLALFDTLFYRIIGRAKFNRHHADFVAQLTAGLAGKRGITDLYAYNGEALIRHGNPLADKDQHEVRDTGGPFMHLIHLRLAVQGIGCKRIDDAAKGNAANLALLDNPALLAHPFTHLFSLAVDNRFSGETLMVFQVTKGAEDPAQKAVRRLLSEQDLLEAIVDFTSYSHAGKTRPHTAWLLNSAKLRGGQTLCIDTRQTLEPVKGANVRHIAEFAIAILQKWRSNDRPKAGNKHQALGPLNGLYAQWFDRGYQDIDGVCRVVETRQALRSAVSSKRVPPRSSLPSFSLLDNRPLTRLLDDTREVPLCVYIIGNNGAGKSWLLASLISRLKEQDTPCSAIAIGPQDRFPHWARQLGDYRYLGDRTENGYSVPAIEGKLISLMVELHKDEARVRTLDHVMDRLGFKHQTYLVPKNELNDVLNPLALSESLQPFGQHIKQTRGTRDKSLAVARQGSTQLFHFSELSSGEQQVLVLFTKIIVAAQPGRVLLIDEPELSLHVHWQQLLPQLLGLIARERSARLIVATHSPTVVANAQDPIDHCFLAKDQQLTDIAPERRHSVETILLEGFETYTPHNREMPERCAALVADAMRAINQEKSAMRARHKQLTDKLGELRDLMKASGALRDDRFERDAQLIDQAQRAIEETFKLAKRQSTV